jgi:DNA gyrase subunit A
LIAMKLEAGEKLVSAKICAEDEDILLATRKGKAIRFPVIDIRVFSGRTSTGVRGIKLAAGDEVISMSVLKHIDLTSDERNAYLKAASKIVLGAEGGEALDPAAEPGAEFEDTNYQLPEERLRELLSKEQLLLTVTNKGFGKRTSAFEYRVTGRGGQGITNMSLTSKNGGEVVATFPVSDNHQIMLVSDEGQLIRTPVENIRTTGRSAQGVTVFKVAHDENVVSVAWLVQEEGDEEDAPGVDIPE